jgi:hypothetical protein
LGYLAVNELFAHSRAITKKYRFEKMCHWAVKARIVQLKVKRPTLRESARDTANSGDLLKFCNHIIVALCTGAFGGKPALWDFLKDIAANLNHSKIGARFSRNSKSFYQAMKMYGGRRILNLFNLNYSGPSYEMKRENQKGVQFIQGVHSKIFDCIAEIYKATKLTHDIIGIAPVILAEDETKVKARVTWDPKFDILAGFYGCKDDHICISDLKPTVGSGEAGYNGILDAFRTNQIGGFAKVIVINPLHPRLPRLVLVVSCTYRRFNSDLVQS